MMIKEWVTIDSLTPKLKSYMEIGFYECRLELNKETKQPTYQIRTNPKYYCEKQNKKTHQNCLN